MAQSLIAQSWARSFDGDYSKDLQEGVADAQADDLLGIAIEYGFDSPVLDLGCGLGYKAIYLAESGFTVDAFDLSSVAIKHLEQRALRDGLAINPVLADIVECELHRSYGLVILCNVLKFIPRDNFRAVVEKLQRHTISGGLHLIRAQKRSPLWEREYGPYDVTCSGDQCIVDLYTSLDEDFLLTAYEGWEVLGARETFDRVLTTDNPPEELEDLYIELILQKP